MAKTSGALLSLRASGQIGNSMVIGSWRGIQYARVYVTPSNPRTTAQTLSRNVFAALDDQFKRMLGLAQAPWVESSKGRPFTARNNFLKFNQRELRPEADMQKYIGSPGVNGGLPGLNPTAVSGSLSGEIDATLDFGQNPVDWSADFVYFTAFPDRDPAVEMTGFVYEASEAGPGASYVPPQTVSHTLTGLTPGDSYIVSMIPVWTRADGFAAYGPSSTLVATALA